MKLYTVQRLRLLAAYKLSYGGLNIDFDPDAARAGTTCK